MPQTIKEWSALNRNRWDHHFHDGVQEHSYRQLPPGWALEPEKLTTVEWLRALWRAFFKGE